MDYRFALIGYPIGHSLSPWIHQQFLAKTNLTGLYTLEEMEPNQFERNFATVKSKNYSGFNVTLPFKQTIIPFLDGLDSHAKAIGAVNTVKNDQGNLIGYNTDGIGYLRSLESAYPNLIENKDKRVLILGAGGAARAIYYALSHGGFQTIDIANRSLDNAQKLVSIKASETTTRILSLLEAEQELSTYDLIIQTTSIGMKPNVNEMPMPLTNVKHTAIISDIIYQPIWTKFLKAGAIKGVNLHFGHTMLLYQAQYAFEIWTGNKPLMNDMETKLKQLLEG